MNPTKMVGTKNQRRLTAVVYYLLTGILIASLLAFIFYISITVFSNIKEQSLVPITLSLQFDREVEAITQNNNIIQATATNAETSIVVSEAPPWFYFFAQIYFLGLFGIGFYITAQLWIIFKSLRKQLKESITFKIQYVKYIRKIGYALIGYAAWDTLFYIYAKYFLIEKLSFAGETAVIEFNLDSLTSVLWGLVVLVLATVFEFGSKLQEDQDLTI
ncbi:MAG: DUF2975 domain-containing protein [Salinivirgaceae bacterium]|jgi:hypothetical protein|nr:DUF2975 domain-containing protein [Salinivirgaceae bacterium]